jgi:putative transposase
LNDAGRAVEASWNKLPERYPNISLDGFVIMPNHVHGIIVVGAPLVGAPVATCGDGATGKRATTRVAPTVGEIMGAFKSITTDEYIRGVKSAAWPSFTVRLWQRNYYEHIIRDDESLNRIRQYISDNPSHWAFDRENPAATTPEPEEAWLA